MGIEDDPLSEHRINETLQKDFERVMNSEHIIQFHKRNEYKSAKTREADEALVNYLLNKLKAYHAGWVKCNSLKTAELWNKSLLLDNQRQALKEDCQRVNTLLNDMIVILKNKMPESALKSLRELEIQFRNLL